MASIRPSARSMRFPCGHSEPETTAAEVDRYTAEDAAALIDLEYEPLPVMTDPLKAMKTRVERKRMDTPSALIGAGSPPGTPGTVATPLLGVRRFRSTPPPSGLDQ